MPIRAAETPPTELCLALNARTSAVTPLIPEAWLNFLIQFDLLDMYPGLPAGLQYGFHMGIPNILEYYHPENKKSALTFADILQMEVDNEIAAGRYLGLFSAAGVSSVLGPFQSAP